MDQTSALERSTSGHEGRVHGFDVLRGFSVCSMVAFHLFYDLKYLHGLPVFWFASPLQDVWRATISWTFLFVAGCMCSHSHNNFRRAIRYLLVAAAIFIATSVVSVDAPISFGIIYCMGICTLAAHLLRRFGCAPEGRVPAIILMFVFLSLLHVSQGSMALGPVSVRLPSILFATPYLSWLGFPGPGFVSSDYYPPIPFMFIYLVGVSMGSYWNTRGIPTRLRNLTSPFLEFAGRHALEVYLLHQPVLLMASGAISALWSY